MDKNSVVVGIDGSEDSKEALRWAVEFGRRYESPVVAIAVWDMPVTYGYVMVMTATGAEIKEGARQMLAQTVREAVGDDAGVTQETRQGHPAATLVDASESAQLLVLGTRGHGAVAGMFLGSVSQHCVSHSKCPFVVVPNPKK